MAKRKKTIDIKEPGIPPTAQEDDIFSKARHPETDYTLGTWAGKVQYRCRRCAFDTLDWARMQAHLLEHSPQPPAPAPSPILVADKRGNEVAAGAPAHDVAVPEGEEYEIELEEIGSTVGEDGNEHKTFTLKED